MTDAFRWDEVRDRFTSTSADEYRRCRDCGAVHRTGEPEYGTMQKDGTRRNSDGTQLWKCRVCGNLRTRTYLQTERGKVTAKAVQQRRRAGGDVSADDLLLLRELYGPECMRCKDETDLTVDHIIPVAHGGKSVLMNLQLLCQSCNSKKGARHATDYRPDKGRRLLEFLEEGSE